MCFYGILPYKSRERLTENRELGLLKILPMVCTCVLGKSLIKGVFLRNSTQVKGEIDRKPRVMAFQNPSNYSAELLTLPTVAGFWDGMYAVRYSFAFSVSFLIYKSCPAPGKIRSGLDLPMADKLTWLGLFFFLLARFLK